MRKELLILLWPIAGYVLWWMGGRGIGRTKVWRRELWPLCCGLLCLVQGLNIWRAIVGIVGGMVAHSLGYGEDELLIFKTLVILALGAWLMLLGCAWWWSLVVSGWFAIGYYFSRLYNDVPWSLIESVTGLLQGVALALTWGR